VRSVAVFTDLLLRKKRLTLLPAVTDEYEALVERAQGVRRAHVVSAFPGAQVTFAPHQKRQQIVDSWPADVDDSAARRDWGFAPRYDEPRAFSEYLVPTIRERYR
jgi:hypothetical protein